MTTRLALLIPENWPQTPECAWALMDRDGTVIQRGHSAPKHWPAATEHVAILDASQSRWVELTIPPARRKDQPKLIAYALEARLARDVDNEHLTVLRQYAQPPAADGAPQQQGVTVLVVNAARLRGICAQFDAIQRPLARAVSVLECVPPAAAASHWKVFVTQPGSAVLSAPGGQAWSLDLPATEDGPGLSASLAQHLSLIGEDPRFVTAPPRHVEFASERALDPESLENLRAALGIEVSQHLHEGPWARSALAHDLLHGPFAAVGRHASRWRALRWPLTVAAVGAAAALVALTVSVLLQRSEEASLHQRSARIFAEALPGTPSIVPERQLRRALDEARRGAGLLAPTDLLSLLDKYSEATGSVPRTFSYRDDTLMVELDGVAALSPGIPWSNYGLAARLEGRQLSITALP